MSPTFANIHTTTGAVQPNRPARADSLETCDTDATVGFGRGRRASTVPPRLTLPTTRCSGLAGGSALRRKRQSQPQDPASRLPAAERCRARQRPRHVSPVRKLFRKARMRQRHVGIGRAGIERPAGNLGGRWLLRSPDAGSGLADLGDLRRTSTRLDNRIRAPD